MGNRDGRKKTRKVKTAKALAGKAGVECRAQGMWIDSSVCETTQIRRPNLCFGCRAFRG